MSIIGYVDGGGVLPWNQIIWPPTDSNLPISWAYNGGARSIPGVGRALSLVEGLVSQMPLDAWRGADKLPRPWVLEQPDPDRDLPWWLGMQVDDYLVNGNALAYVTSRNAEDWPASVVWVPAQICSVIEEDCRPTYWVGGVQLRAEDVLHVQRGADPLNRWRGIGVIEQHLATMRKAQSQERYENSLMATAAVPSVAVIAPNQGLSVEEADAAKEKWLEKYGGDERKPGIFPSGTQVIPLSWSPADQQLVEARKMTLTDVANSFNLDGYWLGAPAGSYTYRSPGPMYLHLMRQTIGPILAAFEAAWTRFLVPRGQRVKADRQAVLGDDMETTIRFLVMAVKNRLMTRDEAREYLGKAPRPAADFEPEGQIGAVL